MRRFLIVTALLAVVLLGLMGFSVHMTGEEHAHQENALLQLQQMESKKEQLKQKEEELARLHEKMEACGEDQEWINLQEEVKELEAQKAELEAQIQQIHADTEALKEKLQSEDSDQSYYLEVYNALTKGLNDVKGYISGN